ncbi:MAG: response regulator, partial [Syntrophaceae bacterium]|nr:response regulator [Syntrophaceae bacterium]
MDAVESRRETIVMVDDDITVLRVADNNLGNKYNFFTAPSGAKLFHILKRVTPDLILIDIEMPDMNGYEAINLLKSAEKTAHIPVIFLTVKKDPECEIKGLDLGAADYITKPFSNALLIKRIDMHLRLERQKIELLNYNRNLEGEILKMTGAVFKLQHTILKTVSELIERRDSVTGGHIERTQRYLRQLVDLLLEHGVYTAELKEWDINRFIASSQLHDVGKIPIRDDILLRKGKLSDEEFEEI